MRKALFFLCALFSMALTIEENNIWRFSSVNEKSLQNVITSSEGKASYTISDLTYEKSMQMKDECLLSFNHSPERMIRDDSGIYRIKKADFKLSKGKGEIGNGCALFYQPCHGIEIDNDPNLFLGNQGLIDSFTIEFRFKALSLYNSGTIFSRTGFLSGAKIGIEISVNNSKVVTRFHRIFEGRGSRKYSFILAKGPLLEKDRWYHYAVCYDSIRGKVASFINGTEQEVRFCTDSGAPGSRPHEAYFGFRDKEGTLNVPDLPSVWIGQNFTGYIDEFRISNLAFEESGAEKNHNINKYRPVFLEDRTPVQHEGTITSQVYAFPDTGTKVIEFNWDEKSYKDTFIWMEFRISDRIYDENDRDIPWIKIENGQRGIFLQKDSSGTFYRGKYFQWRAHLIASPDGKRAPVLSNVRLTYRLDHAPSAPDFPEILSADSNHIRLRWKKNLEADISGYKIYYGVRPGRFEGIITTIKNMPITNRTSDGRYVTVTIDRSVIEENLSGKEAEILDFPHLKETSLYYFAVTAYDSYRTNTSFNHESSLSKTVTARLFSGSDIKTLTGNPR